MYRWDDCFQVSWIFQVLVIFLWFFLITQTQRFWWIFLRNNKRVLLGYRRDLGNTSNISILSVSHIKHFIIKYIKFTHSCFKIIFRYDSFSCPIEKNSFFLLFENSNLTLFYFEADNIMRIAISFFFWNTIIKLHYVQQALKTSSHSSLSYGFEAISRPIFTLFDLSDKKNVVTVLWRNVFVSMDTK